MSDRIRDAVLASVGSGLSEAYQKLLQDLDEQPALSNEEKGILATISELSAMLAVEIADGNSMSITQIEEAIDRQSKLLAELRDVQSRKAKEALLIAVTRIAARAAAAAALAAIA